MFLPDELANTIDMMTDESCGRLMRSLFSGKAPEGGIERMIYTTIKAFLDCQQPTVSEVMSANGKKGGRPKKAAFETEKAAFPEKKAAFETEKAAFETEKQLSEEEESAPCPPSSPSLSPTPPIIPPIIPQPPKEEEGNLTATANACAGDVFGMTMEEAEQNQAVLDTIEDAAKDAGLNTNAYALDNAIRLKDTFGLDPLLNAIRQASISSSKASWAYVEGILKGNGKKPSSKPAKTVSAQQYEQRPYTEEELDNGDFAALLAEARAAR